MNSGLSIYILPALIALLIKLWVLFVSKRGSKLVSETGKTQSSLFFTMVLLFACHNVAEVLGFLEYFSGDRYGQVTRWYYVMSVLALSSIVFYAEQVSKTLKNSKILYGVLGSGALALSAVLLFTDFIVAGSASIGYSLTAVKGSYYAVFQIYSLSAYALIVYFLVVGYKNAEDHRTEIQCAYTMFAMAPLVVVALALMAVMAMGYTVNASVILPFTTAAFLLITLKGERLHQLTDIRRHIPFSLERQTSGEIMDIFSRFASDEVNYRDGMAEIEKLLVMHKHDKNGGNVTTTASSMEIPRSSLYSIFRRLNIELKEAK